MERRSCGLAAGARVWVIALDDCRHEHRARALLGPKEVLRANQFHTERLARRYIAGRAALRILLGEALRLEPPEVPLTTGPHGKPRLAVATDVSFNVSRCEDTAVIGLSAVGDIGVDVEAASRVHEPQELARSFFATSEAVAIAGLPSREAEAAFLRCWTAKEAVLKALGVGLTQPLRDVVVDLDPASPARLRRVPGRRRVSDWTLYELSLLRERLTVAVAIAAADAPLAEVHRFDPARLASRHAAASPPTGSVSKIECPTPAQRSLPRSAMRRRPPDDGS